MYVTRVCTSMCIRDLEIDEAVKRITEQARQPREWSMATVTKLLGDDGDDCVVTELNVSIKCPLLCGRIKHPCRGKECEHLNSYDLATYLEFSRHANKWMCPVCNKPVLPWDLAVCPGGSTCVVTCFSVLMSVDMLVAWPCCLIVLAPTQIAQSLAPSVGGPRVLWAVFESILESVASQPAIETCKIDKSGNISTGSKNVQVKVKDGESTRAREGRRQGGRKEGRRRLSVCVTAQMWP